MGFRVELSATALKQLRKLDRSVAQRVLDYLDAIETLTDRRSRGKALIGDRSELWRYRVGDYRVICDVRDDEVVILALEILHRGVAYDS